jgi:hypothetical protein
MVRQRGSGIVSSFGRALSTTTAADVFPFFSYNCGLLRRRPPAMKRVVDETQQGGLFRRRLRSLSCNEPPREEEHVGMDSSCEHI